MCLAATLASRSRRTSRQQLRAFSDNLCASRQPARVLKQRSGRPLHMELHNLAQPKHCLKGSADPQTGRADISTRHAGRADVLLHHDGVMCQYFGFDVPLQYINEKCAQPCRASGATPAGTKLLYDPEPEFVVQMHVRLRPVHGGHGSCTLVSFADARERRVTMLRLQA